MSDRKVKRLTPNSIANLVMADEAWHDSRYVKAEDYDSLLADFEALRDRLAAPQPEPVAWMCEGYSAAYGDYLNFRSEGERRNSEFQNPKEWKPLYAAPPAAAPAPEPSGYAYRYADGVLRLNDGSQFNGGWPVEAVPYWFAPPALAAPQPEPTHPGYIIGSHWLETAYSRICAGEAEADVLRDYKAAIDAAMKGDKT